MALAFASQRPISLHLPEISAEGEATTHLFRYTPKAVYSNIGQSVSGLGVSMKLHSLLIVGFAFCVSACAEKEAPEPAATPAPEPKAEAPAPAETAAVEEQSGRSDDFIDHMHAHAEQLDDLNFSLADDDLEGAMTAAYWLSGHQEVEGIKEEWRPFLNGMREAARAVEVAGDLETARAAAERINENCQGCHDLAGVND